MKITFCAKMEKFRKIPPILPNFTHFHESSWFSLNFAVLAPRRGHFAILAVPHLLLKQKKVRFRDIFHVLSKKLLFGHKTWFSPKFLFRGEKSLLGLQKRAQNVTFIKGFARGARLGPKSLKKAVLHPKTHFWGPGPQGIRHVHEMLSISLGISMVLACRESWNSWKFHDFHEILVFLRNQRETFSTFAANMTFSHLGGRKPENLV